MFTHNFWFSCERKLSSFFSSPDQNANIEIWAGDFRRQCYLTNCFQFYDKKCTCTYTWRLALQQWLFCIIYRQATFILNKNKTKITSKLTKNTVNQSDRQWRRQLMEVCDTWWINCSNMNFGSFLPIKWVDCYCFAFIFDNLPINCVQVLFRFK